jgi:hypothetical protein
MTSKEYVIWLKGFVEACHEYAPTPKQWDALKDKLEEVKDDTTSSPFPFGVPNTAPIVTLPYITPGPSTDPYNPYKITCSSGSFGTITTTPGTGYITTYNPVQFGSGSIYNVSTSMTRFPISGSSVSYTNGGNDIKD